MRMLGRILGTPERDLDWLVEKGDQLIANADPEFTKHVVDRADTDAYRLMPFRSPAGSLPRVGHGCSAAGPRLPH